MKQTIFLFFVLLSTSLVHSELAAQSTFQKTFGNLNGNEANAVIKTNEGGYALAGWYDVDGLFSAEFYLVVTDALGDTLWMRTYGSNAENKSTLQKLNGSGNEGYNVIQTHDDGFLFIGERHVVVGGQSDVYAVKIGKEGNLQWSKTYGGTDNDYGYAVSQTEDKGYIIGGFTESFGAGIRDLYVIKTDSLGEPMWTKTYGESSIEAALDMQQTSDGGFILVGYTFSFSGSSDIYVIRTDENGDIVWEKTYGGSLNELGQSIKETEDGGFIICGETESYGAGFLDAFVLKIDSDGVMDWSKTYGGEGFESSNSIIQSIDGGYALAGYTRSFGQGNEDFFFVKVDESGNPTWAKTFGDQFDDSARSLTSTLDNGYVLAGYTRSFGAGFSDMYMIKTDSLGRSGCEQDIIDLKTADAPFEENTVTSIVGEGMVSANPGTRTGLTRTKTSSTCDNINSVDEANHEDSFSIYPNPSEDYIFIASENNVHGEIYIYNNLGQNVLSIPFTKNKIDISNIPSGIYILNLKIDNRSISKMFSKD